MSFEATVRPLSFALAHTECAMARTNLELVRQVYEAFNRGDWDAAFRRTAPDFELTTERGLDAGTLRSRAAVQGFFEDYGAAFDGLVVEIDELLETGDQVVALVTRRARPRGANVDMVVRNGHVWTVRDGKIVAMRSYPDPEAARAAAGLGGS